MPGSKDSHLYKTIGKARLSYELYKPGLTGASP